MSTDQHPNEADKADDGKASGNEGFHLDCPPIGMRTVFPRKLRVLDLFSGIGGFSLGLERATLPGAKINGFETVAFCEIEDFPRRVLAKHWPNVPCYDDVRTLTTERLGAVDVITGGFPCQDLSCAGRQAGMDEGTRSGLWSEILRLARDLRPRFIIVENVAALLSGPSEQPGAWFGRVLGDLASIGYDAEWENIPASALGAPHRRERVWLVAYPERGDAQELGVFRAALSKACRETPDRSLHDGDFGLGWPIESRILRSGDGVPQGAHRLKALGNAVVPQIPELIGNAVLQSLNNTGSKGTDGPRFAVSDFPFCHAGENDHD